jgi:hypothetical protein
LTLLAAGFDNGYNYHWPQREYNSILESFPAAEAVVEIDLMAYVYLI